MMEVSIKPKEAMQGINFCLSKCLINYIATFRDVPKEQYMNGVSSLFLDVLWNSLFSTMQLRSI